MIDILKYLLLAGLGIVALYLASRIISYAIAKSWYQVKNQQKERGVNYGIKKKKIESKEKS